MKAVITGVAVTVIGGLILAYLNGVLFSNSNNDARPPVQTYEPLAPSQLKIDYQLSGRSVILGPNPDGEWASKPGASIPYYWHAMEILVDNQCKDPIFIDSDLFRLYVTSQPTTENAENFNPTREGMQYQTKRISNTWLEPGSQTSGTLFFRVPASELQDGTDVDGAYNILRYRGKVECDTHYSPR